MRFFIATVLATLLASMTMTMASPIPVEDLVVDSRDGCKGALFSCIKGGDNGRHRHG
ncbi:hypothetical protein BDP27DRAFT_1325929 [Rhodocollybia butyracea]|uniref:Uncharacterized protein n=1 Tax=Rhodocollybia butyracea TaxID=206335 RepID=A0A9P5U6P3_9AGAR|nr:hypothetical protein BDP27DRAFT_1325929 [Rhodocollybia butyracea]